MLKWHICAAIISFPTCQVAAVCDKTARQSYIDCIYMNLGIPVVGRFLKYRIFVVVYVSIIFSETGMIPGLRKQILPPRVHWKKEDSEACKHLTTVSDSCQLPGQVKPQQSDVSPCLGLLWSGSQLCLPNHYRAYTQTFLLCFCEWKTG